MSIKFLRIGLRQQITGTERVRSHQIKRGLLVFCHIVQKEDATGYVYMGWNGLSKALDCERRTATAIKNALIQQHLLKKAGKTTNPACFITLKEEAEHLLPEPQNCQIKYYSEIKQFFPKLAKMGLPNYGFYFLEIAALLCNSKGFVLLKDKEIAAYSQLSLSTIEYAKRWLRKHDLIEKTKALGFSCWRLKFPIVGFGHDLKGPDFIKWLEHCQKMKKTLGSDG